MTKNPDTYYSTTKVNCENWPQCRGELTVDVAIVGAGFAGLTAARELALAGYSVALLEAKEVGFGASGRNGGFVSAGFALSAASLVERLGKDHAGELYALSTEGVDYISAAIADLNMTKVDPVPGWLNVRRYDGEQAVRREIELLETVCNRPVDYWSLAKVRSHLKTRKYFQGIHDSNAFHIHPLNYALQLAKGAVQAGAQVFEKSHVLEMQHHSAGFDLRTVQGRVRAGRVIITGSAYLGRLYPAITRAVLPVATQVMVSAPLDDPQCEALAFAGAVTDTRRAGDYYRMLPDRGEGQRLLWGGRITTRRATPKRLGALLKQDAVKIFPQLGDMQVAYSWSGFMGYAIHKMPLIAEMEPGLWACTAFGGHGLNTTAMGGVLVARAIAQGDDRVNLFSPFKARWGGGFLGAVATQSTYWFMQAADWLEETKSGLVRR